MTTLTVDLWNETEDGCAPAIVNPSQPLAVGDAVAWRCFSSSGVGVVESRDADIAWVRLEVTPTA